MSRIHTSATLRENRTKMHGKKTLLMDSLCKNWITSQNHNQWSTAPSWLYAQRKALFLNEINNSSTLKTEALRVYLRGRVKNPSFAWSYCLLTLWLHPKKYICAAWKWMSCMNRTIGCMLHWCKVKITVLMKEIIKGQHVGILVNIYLFVKAP